MALKALTETATSWGLNDSTVRKQAGKRFRVEKFGHTLFIDDAGEDFLAWLREHVLSQRLKGCWSALVELANLTLVYRQWPQGTTDRTFEALQQPLKALLEAVRPVPAADGADLEGRGEQVHQACERAMAAYVQGPAIVTALCTLFFRLLSETYGGSVGEMLKQEHLLLYAYAVYQEEAEREQAHVFSNKGESSLALGDAPVQVGEAYLLHVMGYHIEGRVAFDPSLGWHLVAADKSVILLKPGMRGQHLVDYPAQESEQNAR